MSYENLKTKYEMACETVHPPAIEPYRYFNRTCFYRTEKLEMSPEEREKLRYLQPYIIGGHAERICTAFAPWEYKKSTVSLS